MVGHCVRENLLGLSAFLSGFLGVVRNTTGRTAAVA